MNQLDILPVDQVTEVFERLLGKKRRGWQSFAWEGESSEVHLYSQVVRELAQTVLKEVPGSSSIEFGDLLHLHSRSTSDVLFGDTRRHFLQKTSEVLNDEAALRLLVRFSDGSVIETGEFDTQSIALAKLTAANLCEIGSTTVYITEVGKRFVHEAEYGQHVHRMFDDLSEMTVLAVSGAESAHTGVGILQEEFVRLAAEWKQETAHLSSPSAIAQHRAYQEVIEMGTEAIPLILEDLRDSQAQWFLALRAIARESPVLPEDRGNIPAMTRAWLEWGKGQGYI